MKNSIRWMALVAVAVFFSSVVSANPGRLVKKEQNPCTSSSNLSIQIQRSQEGGGEWSNCQAVMKGPDILCVDDDGVFRANLKGSIPPGCDAGPEKVRWTTTFNKKELTPKRGKGATFKVLVQTDKNRTGKIIATHPCCGKAVKTLTLNGDLKSEQESTEIKDVTPNVTKDDFKEQLNQTIGDKVKISKKNEKELIDMIKQKFKENKDKLPNNWFIDLQSKAEEWLPQVVGKIKGSVKEYNEAVEKGVDNAASNIKSTINALTPNVLIEANYKFRECSCDPASPGLGWTDPTATVDGPTNIRAGGMVEINLPIDIKPAGVGITIPAGAKAEIKLSLKDYGVVNGSENVTPIDRPKANASARPLIKTSASGSFTVGTGVSISVSGGIENQTPLDRVEGPIEFDCSSE